MKPKYVAHITAGLMFLVMSCGRTSLLEEPPAITGGGGNPSSSHPAITDVYPSNGSGSNPTNTEYVIIFNIPIDPSTLSPNLLITSVAHGNFTEGTDFTITVSPDGSAVTITFISTLTANDTVTIFLKPGIATTEGATLDNPGARSFGVGTTADLTAPAVNAATRDPAGGSTGVQSDKTISVQFTEDRGMNVATLNSDTFYLRDDSQLPATVKVNAVISYDAATKTARLDPVDPLGSLASYTMFVTTGVTDLSKNALAAASSWSFTTAMADPVPGSPSVTSGITINGVTTITADISWSTSEDTNYTLTYGRNSDASGITPISDLATFMPSRTQTLASLVAGKRYYVKVDYQDIVGNGGATSAVREFNTITADTPNLLADGPGDQHQLFLLENRFTVSPNGIFAFWTDDSTGNRQIQGQLIDGSAVEKWGTVKALFAKAATDHYFLAAAEDELGGAIVLTSQGGTGIYAMRIDKDGSLVDWGPTATTASDGGLLIDATGSEVSAVPVYAGMVEPVTSGVTEHPVVANPIYDHKADFTGVPAGSVVMDDVDQDGTTVSPTNHAYFLDQASVKIDTGHIYFIGDASTYAQRPAQDHFCIGALNHISGNPETYSVHDDTFPGWMDAGDIISDGIIYGRLTSPPNLISIATIIYPSTTSAGSGGTILYDSSIPDFTLIPVNPNYLIEALPQYSVVNTVYTDHLELMSSILSGPGQAYSVFSSYCTSHPTNPVNPFSKYQHDISAGLPAGTTFNIYDYMGITGTAVDHPAKPLYDNDADFKAITPPLPVVKDDVVLNYSTFGVATVTEVPYSVQPKALDLDTDIFGDAEDYRIVRVRNGFAIDKTNIIAHGSSGGPASFKLIRSTGDFTLVTPGNVAYNLFTGESALVTQKDDANTLSLSRDIFASGQDYLILNQRGVIHFWQDGVRIYAKIMGMEGTPPPVLKAKWVFASNANTPKAIPDGRGNALIFYVDVNGEVTASKVDAAGLTAWSTEVNVQTAVNETLHKVISDSAGGAIILTQIGADMTVQRIDADGNRLWGADGRFILNPAGASQPDMAYDAVNDDVVIAVNAYDDIWVVRTGSTLTWPGVYISSAIGIQRNPKIFLNPGDQTNSRIVWEDDRFSGFAGYGIFGISINFLTGSVDPGWYADDTLMDLNGIALVLNPMNVFWPNIRLMNYGAGGNAFLFWEDWRAGQGADLYYENNIFSFVP